MTSWPRGDQSSRALPRDETAGDAENHARCARDRAVAVSSRSPMEGPRINGTHSERVAADRPLSALRAL